MTNPDPVEQKVPQKSQAPFVWPFPKRGIPTPPSKKQAKRDMMDELSRLGEALI